MNLADDLDHIGILFIDTAPIIYYIEAHPEFGPLVKEVVDSFQAERLRAFSSVVTIAEVLPKPIAAGDVKLARKFSEFLRYGKNLRLVEISIDMAERAGRLRGQYSHLRIVDAIQLSTAMEVGADAFLTNDKKLKQIKEMKILVLKDYL